MSRKKKNEVSLLEILIGERKKQGIKQKEMARRLNLHQPVFNRIELGKQKVRYDVIERYAKELGGMIVFIGNVVDP